jgi:ATP-dependent helicase/nuclease subunit A
VLGIAAADDPTVCAATVASEIARILREDTVRDRKTGVPRQATPGDIAILFRSRASHREFEQELERAGIPTYVYKGLGFFDADETKDVVALVRYLARPVSDLRAAAFLRSRFVRLSDRALSLLAPGLAASLTDPQPPAAFALLGDEDQRVLTHIRRQVGAWLDRVDRVPPADLLEQLLRETAYAYELRGPRRLQAWENLKKIRTMIRRIQNRGYATLPRIADHIDALTAGDESNAVIEALDAVNLMTVHAAKGLEFPIVFVVNMSKGASGPPKPIRVVSNGEEEPSVSVGPFVSDSDEADREREKHETRRLLYVAFTRARDRLYLASALKSGAMAPGRGSLGEVLPESLKALFARAASAFPECQTLAWTGSSGRTYELRLCQSPSDAVAGPAASATLEPDSSRQLVGPCAVSPRPFRTSVSRWLEGQDAAVRWSSPVTSDVLVGRLVHRLFQHAAEDDEHVRDRARALVANDEWAAVEDPMRVVDAAVAAWRAIRCRPEVVSLVGSGRLHYEVPFSLHEPESRTILRGTIDCLVQKPDGHVTVIEFKTGARRPLHDHQLSIYVRAASILFPGSKVEGRLIYP